MTIDELKTAIWECFRHSNEKEIEYAVDAVNELVESFEQEVKNSYNKGFADGFSGAEAAHKLMKRKSRTGGTTFTITPKE